MTKERFSELFNLVDEVNKKVYAAVSLEHCKWNDRVHISLFYSQESRTFTNDKFTYDGCVLDDADMTCAEAFMKLLLASAEHYEPMRNPYND